MLRSLQPEIPLPLPVSDAAQSASGDVGRNRSITRRRLQHYGPTPGCASCLNGTYQHTHTHRHVGIGSTRSLTRLNLWLWIPGGDRRA